MNNHGNNDDINLIDTPIWQWSHSDKIKGYSLLSFAALLMIVAALNTYSVLMNSGMPAFLDAPWIAAFMSVLVPSFSMAFKSVYDVFALDSSKKTYTWCVFILTSILVLVWVILFALTYEGAGSQIDWDSLGESSHSPLASILTATQIAAEVLTSATLILGYERLQAGYSAWYFITNPLWTERKATLESIDADYGAVVAARIKAQAKLAKLNASKEAALEASANTVRILSSTTK